MRYTWAFVHRVLIALMVLGFGMALVGVVGEVLGWWNDVGQTLVTVGTIVGALAGTVELVSGASEGTVEAVREDVGGVREALGSVRAEVGGVREDVGEVHDAVEANGEQLGKLETLDDIQRALDKQTGVLEEMRDAG